MSTWNVDPAHTSVTFAVRHLGFSKVRGRFKSFTGKIETPSDDTIVGAKAAAEVDIASVDTDQADRDAHLRNSDFFDAPHHPKMSFASRGIRQGADGLEVEGDLTIRGVTKSVVFEVGEFGRAKDPWGNDRVVFDAHTKVNRKDFGLLWNVALEAGGFLVGDTVDIDLEVQAVKAK